jgi:hypothetical protein
LYRKGRLTVLSVLAAMLLMCLLMISRMDPNLFGALRAHGAIHDSIPRYWTPVYLFAALPPVLLLASLRGRVFIAGLLGLCALAGFSIYEVAWRMGVDQGHFREGRHDLATLSVDIPRGAVVYTPTYDKVLWSHTWIGTALEPKPAAQSMRRAVDNGFDTYLWLPPTPANQIVGFELALEAVGLKLVKADKKRRLYRVAPGA